MDRREAERFRATYDTLLENYDAAMREANQVAVKHT